MSFFVVPFFFFWLVGSILHLHGHHDYQPPPPACELGSKEAGRQRQGLEAEGTGWAVKGGGKTVVPEYRRGKEKEGMDLVLLGGCW